MKWFGAFVVVTAAALVASGCTAESQSSPPLDPAHFADQVTIDAVTEHLQQFEDIASANGGNRAAGTPGYDATVDYVVDALEAEGFEVSTPKFDYSSFSASSTSLTGADGADTAVQALTYSPSTGPNGIAARLVSIATDETPGCEAADYDGTDVTGAIVLVSRGVCPFGEKQSIAAEHGAAALLIANNEDTELADATLGDPEETRIPTGGVSKSAGEALASAGGDLTLVLDTSTTKLTSRNVIAQTKTGATDNVVLAGAHLDSVSEGPGINDNGTGAAAVLETALQLGSSPDIENAVRFAFWGAEEAGLVGSTHYADGLSDQERNDIALYLNFDMLGSPEAGYFAYDGDDSDASGEGPGPTGSAGIERTFVDFLAGRGVTAQGTDFDGRSDYGPFIEIGIPAGGVFSGADEEKTAAQAREWGGNGDTTFDPNYHSAGDTLENVNRDVLAVNAAAVAFGVATYARDVSGPNGVPVGDERTEARTK